MVVDKGQMSVAELAKITGVSEVTIRQDLNTLEKQSYLRRAHGFAVSLESDDVETRMMTNYTLKRRLAEFAASLVSPGESVFIENGSSNALLARTLAEQKDVTIITVSSYIAHLLKETPCEVILLGGIYQKKSESMVGPLTRQFIHQVHFSKAFIGIDGWQADTGFTGRDMMRSDVVNAVLEKRLRSDCPHRQLQIWLCASLSPGPALSLPSCHYGFQNFRQRSNAVRTCGAASQCYWLIRLKYFPMVCPMANHPLSKTFLTSQLRLFTCCNERNVVKLILAK